MYKISDQWFTNEELDTRVKEHLVAVAFCLPGVTLFEAKMRPELVTMGMILAGIFFCFKYVARVFC